MRNKILNDIIIAMKAKDKETLSVLRMVKGAMQLEEINIKRELNDDEVISVITKQIKTRKESIKEFENAGRTDLASKTASEVEILEKYMPEQMSEDEIISFLNNVLEEVKPESMKDMGKIMGKASLLKGKADLGLVSNLVKSKLEEYINR